MMYLPEWLLLLPIWLSDWLWATCGRSWMCWRGVSHPEAPPSPPPREPGPAPALPFSRAFISISSWWIHRSGGRSSFWLPFLLPPALWWVARFLTHTHTHTHTRLLQPMHCYTHSQIVTATHTHIHW